MKWIKKFNESKSENHIGFERKLREILDTDKVEEIMSLIPTGVIMPIFYKGDKAILKDSNKEVIITDSGYKNREYIYYYELDDDDVYSYESDFII